MLAPRRSSGSRVGGALAALAVLVLAAACGGGGSGGSPSSGASSPGSPGSPASSSSPGSSTAAPGSGSTIAVPAEQKTIGAAAAAAKPGDTILVSAGVYKEEVHIKTPNVTLRGVDRNAVIIDGEVLRPNGVVLTGAGDVVQNLTVRNATLNGVLITGQTDAQGNGIGNGSNGYTPTDPSRFPPLQGFLVDHVTSYNNGLYGIYAFDAQNGMIQNSYTSGMADSGIYVGQCKPCNIGVTGNIAERNAVGYEGTNASQNMYVWGNRFVGNRVGATTDSDYQEALVPQDGATVVGNVIAANNGVQTPEQADGGFGIGLGIAGGTNNLVSNNLIQANSVVGLAITNFNDLAPIGNQVVSNMFSGNGLDVGYGPAASAAGTGNCLSGNTLTTVSPATLPQACPAAGSVVAPAALPSSNAPRGIAFTAVPPPPNQPQLSDAGPAAVSGPPANFSPAAIPVPAASLLAESSLVTW